jgi:hypothetical protein
MQWAGKELPESVRQGQRLTTMTANQKQLILPGITKFPLRPERRDDQRVAAALAGRGG